MPETTTAFNPQQTINDAIQVMFPGPCVVEIRSPKAGKNGTICGYFELPQHIDRMVNAIMEISGDYNVYWTLNPVDRSLLARSANKLRHHMETTTGDHEIIQRLWLPLDFDPQRATGISSTDEEKRAARTLASKVKKWLKEEMGWPDPVVADSGNGFHLLYRIDLPNDDESRELLKAVLDALAHKFDTTSVKIDQKLFNASRILKAYGSLAVKGDNIRERPHRMSMMFQPPAVIQTVGLEQLLALPKLRAVAETAAPKPKKARASVKEDGGGWTQEMVEAGLGAAGVEFKPPLTYKSGVKWQHDCFNNPEHKSPDAFTMLDGNGWVSEKCSHNTCGDGLNSGEWVQKIEAMAGHEIDKPIRKKPDVRESLAAIGAEDADYNRETDGPLTMFPLHELGTADRMEWRYGGKFLHTDATGWLTYHDGRWQRDKTGEVEQAVENTINLIGLEAGLATTDKMAEAVRGFEFDSHTYKMLNAVRGIAEGRAVFSRNYADFDQRKDLFLCGNGTYHLDTGEFGPFDPTHLLAKGSNVIYDPTAVCPQWEKFLFEVMDEKTHMVDYLRRCCGYTLTANTGEQCMFIPYGCGGTGKGTFLNVMQGILGSYYQTADPEMLMVKRGDSGQPFEMAGMEGARAIVAQETEKGKTLALSKLKRMTGQDPIRASYKGRDHYTFVPDWKLWLATNDEPSADAGDDAWWERVKVIPFNVKFRDTERQIRNLHIKLLAEESSGIFNWFLRGHREWKEGGLQHPPDVAMAVGEWRETEDYLGRCLDERFAPTTNPQEYVSKAQAFEVFGRWSVTSKEGEGISPTEFGKQMRAKGYVDKPVLQKVDGKNKTVRCWMGLKAVSSLGSGSVNPPDPKDVGF